MTSIWKVLGLCGKAVRVADGISVFLISSQHLVSWQHASSFPPTESALFYFFKIPPEIGCLENLTSFDVSYNSELRFFPNEMGKLSKIWDLPLDELRLNFDFKHIGCKAKDIIRSDHFISTCFCQVCFGARL